MLLSIAITVFIIQNHNFSAWYSDLQFYPNQGTLGPALIYFFSFQLLSVIILGGRPKTSPDFLTCPPKNCPPDIKKMMGGRRTADEKRRKNLVLGSPDKVCKSDKVCWICMIRLKRLLVNMKKYKSLSIHLIGFFLFHFVQDNKYLE